MPLFSPETAAGNRAYYSVGKKYSLIIFLKDRLRSSLGIIHGTLGIISGMGFDNGTIQYVTSQRG